MHIVFVTPSLSFGGAERVICNLSNQMIKEHKISIIVTSSKSKIAYDLNGNVDVFYVDENNIFNKWLNVRRICKNICADVAIAFMTNVGVFVSLFMICTKIPVIVSERNDPKGADQEMGLLMRILKRISYKFTKGYVFQSVGAKKCYPKCVQKKSCVILNPLDTQEIPHRDNSAIDNRIVTVGRLHKQKNHQLLIDAFSKSQASDSHTLHIYGDGVLKKELQEQILKLELKDKVFLEGNKPNVHKYIKNAKMFVFTSNYEGLPNALMEAMAIGIPVISTDCSPGGARMLIEDGVNGLLVPCDNVQLLANAMDRYYSDYKFAQECGNNAIKLTSKTDVKNIAEQWISHINKIVQGDKNDK